MSFGVRAEVDCALLTAPFIRLLVKTELGLRVKSVTNLHVRLVRAEVECVGLADNLVVPLKDN